MFFKIAQYVANDLGATFAKKCWQVLSKISNVVTLACSEPQKSSAWDDVYYIPSAPTKNNLNVNGLLRFATL